MLGRIYYQEGHVDQAIGQFERMLKLILKHYKAWDNLGLCWQARGENEKAIAHFLRAIKLVEKDHPEYDWAYANLADLLVQTGDADERSRPLRRPRTAIRIPLAISISARRRSRNWQDRSLPELVAARRCSRSELLGSCSTCWRRFTIGLARKIRLRKRARDSRNSRPKTLEKRR